MCPRGGHRRSPGSYCLCHSSRWVQSGSELHVCSHKTGSGQTMPARGRHVPKGWKGARAGGPLSSTRTQGTFSGGGHADAGVPPVIPEQRIRGQQDTQPERPRPGDGYRVQGAQCGWRLPAACRGVTSVSSASLQPLGLLPGSWAPWAPSARKDSLTTARVGRANSPTQSPSFPPLPTFF